MSRAAAKAAGTLKLRTLRKAGVKDLGHMYQEMPTVKEHHLTWADEAGLAMLELLVHSHARIRGLAEEMVSHLNKEQGEIVVLDGGFPPISEMLTYKDLDVQRDALWTLSSLAASSESNHVPLIQDITWHTILNRSKGEGEIREAAVSLIANLAINEANHDMIMQEGGIESLKSAAKSGNLKLERAACNAFANLTANPENIEKVISDGGLDQIFAFLKSGDDELVAAALHTLANITQHCPEAKNRLLAGGHVPDIIKLMNHQNPLVRNGATAVIQELLGDQANHKALMDAGVLDPLCQLGLKSRDPQTQYLVAASLNSLAGNPEYRNIVKEKGLRPLKQLVRSKDEDVKQEAIDALAKLGVKAVSKADKEKARADAEAAKRAQEEEERRKREEEERRRREEEERKRREEEERRKREEEERRRREEEERRRREEEERRRREEEERRRREEADRARSIEQARLDEERRRREEEERRRREEEERRRREEEERRRKEEEALSAERAALARDEAWRHSLLEEMNFVRTRPKEYAASLEKLRSQYDGNDFFLTPTRVIETDEGSAALDDALRCLRAQAPLPPFERVSDGMSMSSQDLCNEVGPSGRARGGDTSQRWERYGQWKGRMVEIIGYRIDDPQQAVQQWVLDDGNPDRTNRNYILDPEFKVVGYAHSFHKTRKTMVVVQFANGFDESTERSAPRDRSVQPVEDLNADPNATHIVIQSEKLEISDRSKLRLAARGRLLHLTSTTKEEVTADGTKSVNVNFRWQLPIRFDTKDVQAKLQASGKLLIRVPKKAGPNAAFSDINNPVDIPIN